VSYSVLATRLVLGAACAVSVLLGSGIPAIVSTADASPTLWGDGASAATAVAPSHRSRPRSSSASAPVSVSSPRNAPLLGALQAGSIHDGELSMIELQSVVSQRQQAIQFTTQVAAAQATQTAAILPNIGR
jgi:hypothetical protein